MEKQSDFDENILFFEYGVNPCEIPLFPLFSAEFQGAGFSGSFQFRGMQSGKFRKN